MRLDDKQDATRVAQKIPVLNQGILFLIISRLVHLYLREHRKSYIHSAYIVVKYKGEW